MQKTYMTKEAIKEFFKYFHKLTPKSQDKE